MTAQAISPPRTHPRWLPPLLLLAGGSLLGLSTNLAKLAGGVGLTPLAFLAWSVTGAAAILLFVAMWRRSPPPVNSRSLRYYTVSALVSVAGSNFIFFAAIPHVGVSFVALIITLPPLLTYIGALLLGMEGFHAIRATGVAAALAGAGVLAASKLVAPDADIFWILLALFGPVLLAIGNLYRSLRWPTGVSAQALAPGMLLAAAIMLLLAGLLLGFSLAIPLDSALPVMLIVMQSLVFAAQFHLLFLLQKAGGPVLLSLLGSVGAVVGVPVAIYLQNEAPPEGLMPSAALIAVGVVLVALGQAKSISRQEMLTSKKRNTEMNIAIIGAAGDVGRRIVAEALLRGHRVSALVRSEMQFGKLPIATVCCAVDISNAYQTTRAIEGHDIVISAVRPPDGQEDLLAGLTRSVLDAAITTGIRAIIVGGASRLKLPGGGGANLLTTPGFLPASVVPIARACQRQYELCLGDALADWTYLSPPVMLEPGARTGLYRLGTDTLVMDDNGVSRISMEDFAVALLDEVEEPKHIRRAFTVG